VPVRAYPRSFKLEVSSVKQEKTGIESVASDFKLDTSHFTLLKITPHGVTTNHAAVLV
jgi:hypothetical protein